MYRKYLLASKTPNGAVIRIWKEGEPDGESISLRNSPSVHKAKIIAIQTCAKGILTYSHGNGSVEILAHSQGALKALKAVKFNSEVVWTATGHWINWLEQLVNDHLYDRNRRVGVCMVASERNLLLERGCKILEIYRYQGRLRKAVSLSRPRLGMFISILTGHCTLNKYLQRMGLAGLLTELAHGATRPCRIIKKD